MDQESAERREWLEADGLGGFASGTAAGIRTRRYHALLLHAATPPTGRCVLVAGLDAEVSTAGASVAISSQRYVPGVVHPDGVSRLERFGAEPWPTWTYAMGEGGRIIHELFVPKGLPLVVLRWRAEGLNGAPARLRVRPFLAGRDYHATHHENPLFHFLSEDMGTAVRWHPYAGVPATLARHNGNYRFQPYWYRRFEYAEEQARGLDSVEDLASPGVFDWDVSTRDAVLVFAAETEGISRVFSRGSPEALANQLAQAERQRRKAFTAPLHRAADAYLVSRGTGTSIIAGYPWFTDWGRDTFIAMRGLCLATGRYAEARQILLAWSTHLSEGMLPNRFPDSPDDGPDFNTVDAALWFVIAAHELFEADRSLPAEDRAVLHGAISDILDGYTRSTRSGIRAEDDGLLAAGAQGVSLTWMDARVAGETITPRIGKPVEVQALWINALWVGSLMAERWKAPFVRATRAFEMGFWNQARGMLFDVLDVDHVHGRTDEAFRPNQILAIGGLPLQILQGPRARSVVDAVEAGLWTPMGLRSLDAGDPAYQGRYTGGPERRDRAYHQGTVWTWLVGPFIEAWLRVRGNTAQARNEARERFLNPLLTRTDLPGTGHLPEVADGDFPHPPGGCPFQAWSVGEALRVERVLSGTPPMPPGTGPLQAHRQLSNPSG